MITTAIIPVYNEELTVEAVCDVVVDNSFINKVVIVDDGSTDSTSKILKKYEQYSYVKVISLPENVGKGNAVRKATENIQTDIYLFIDADLMNLGHEHIYSLISSMDSDTAMVIGLRDKGKMASSLAPLTSGERAIKAEVFAEVRKIKLIEGWGLESVINHYCRKKRLKVRTVKLDGVDHIGIQTKKYGLGAFLKECFSVFRTRMKLIRFRYD
jgi:glycosyltransferase involved in cell wall biosynthesis